MVSVDVLSPSPLSSAPLNIHHAHAFDSINTFTSDSGNTSLNDEQRQHGAIKIKIIGTKDGLGIRIVDAINILKQACGIFVKEVIAGSLAERDGQLKVGDQLLEVNGINLIGVTREDCRKIMERCTATNQLILLVARDHQSREDFHRLSVSLGNVINPSIMHHIDFNTTTQMTDNIRFSTISTLTNDTARKSTGSTISSASLTQVSDISDELKDIQKVNATGSSQTSVKDTTSGQISTTDVVLEVPSDTNEKKPPSLLIPPLSRKSISSSEDDSPPPLPSSEPPALEDDTFNNKFQSEDLIMPKKRVPTNAEASMAAAASSIAAIAASKNLSPGDSKEPEIIKVITIAKQSALGLTICGGTNKPEGPHVYIDRVIAGLDVANDGTLRPGDRLITVNGESMEGVTKEHALRILTQLKLKPNTKEYQIVYGRKDNRIPPTSSSMQTPARKIQPVTPSTIGQPTVMYNSSIFDSAADSTIHIPSTSTTVPNDTTTLTSSKMNTAKFASTLASATAATDDDVDWHSKDEDVVMRDKTTKQESYKRLTMDPRKKVAFDKLIMAMEYMGRKVSETDQEKMRQSLRIQPGGKVAFQEFADLVKDMFKFKLDMSMMEPTLMGGIERKDSIEIPPLTKSSSSLQTSSDLSHHSQKEGSPKHGSHIHSKDQDAELERMRQLLHQEGERREEERIRQQQMLMSQDAVNQQALLRMQAALQEKDQHCKHLEAQVERLKKQVEVENKAKYNRAQLEERLLSERSKLPKNVEELRKRLAVLDCELRKEQNTSRRYQVITERLIQLAESVQEALAGSDKAGGVFYHPRGTPARRGDPVTGNPRPPYYLSKHSRNTNETLSKEVKETLTAAKKMLDYQPMPHGWEESYIDGEKFYINHEKQITSWVNPITQAFAGTSRSSRSSSQTTSRTASHISITPPQQ